MIDVWANVSPAARAQGLAAVLMLLMAAPAIAQPGGRSMGPPPNSGPKQPSNFSPRDYGPQFAPSGSGIRVADVQIMGNQTVSRSKIESFLKTRTGRVYDPIVLETDAAALQASGLFRDVHTYTREMPTGIAVTFEVFERATIREVRVVGNRGLSDKAIKKQTGLEKGDAIDLYKVQEGRRKIEEFYLSKGYAKPMVTILEGDRLNDRDVVYAVHEGPQQRIWDTSFVGNTIATDGRLLTQVQSKPGPIKYFFGGEVDSKKIQEDEQRLEAYYNSLGFFRVRVGHDLQFNGSGEWAYLTFFIDEGPRYKVRNVSVVGNSIYTNEQLLGQLQLERDQYFNQAEMLADENTLRDLYGGQGYVYADIVAKPRFLLESGQLDVVYDIREGEQWRVGRINIHIGGEYSHTRHNVVRNRISLQPGDIIDMRKLRDSERRLKASQLFLSEPARGIEPRVVVRPPEVGSIQSLASRTSNYRGQSPDGARPRPRVRYVEVDYYVPPFRR